MTLEEVAIKEITSFIARSSGSRGDEDNGQQDGWQETLADYHFGDDRRLLVKKKGVTERAELNDGQKSVKLLCGPVLIYRISLVFHHQ